MDGVLPNSILHVEDAPGDPVSIDVLELQSRAKTVEFKLNVAASEHTNLDAQIDEIEHTLRTGNQAAIRLLLEGSQAYVFQYKKRRCLGGALHIAALHARGSHAVRELLKLKADVSAECKYVSFDREGSAQPIHLALQSGLENVQLLIAGGASVNARAKVAGQNHFCPLHEAAFFRNADALQYLLDARANVDAANQEGMTALHVSAKMGASDIAEILVRSKANIEVRDDNGRSALEIAVESGSFLRSSLHILAKLRIEDILVVAEHCPSATTEFMRNLLNAFSGSGSADLESQKLSVAQQLQSKQDLTVEHWLELMEESPEAGNYLLKILTVEPDQDSEFHHPLPHQAILNDMRCDYNTDDTWKCDTEKGGKQQWPDWHEKLAPAAYRPRKNKRKSNRPIGDLTDQGIKFVDPALLEPVQMRQLRFRGIICPQVLQILAMTTNLEVFDNPAVHAIVRYCWDAFVARWHAFLFFNRLTELVVLIVWTYSRTNSGNDITVSQVQRRLSWSIVCASALRETVAEISQAYGSAVTLGSYWSYFGILGNYSDAAVIILVNVVVLQAMVSDRYEIDFWRPIFATMVLCRWLQLLHTLRPFNLRVVGVQGLIPILHSAKNVSGMMTICAFVYFGFLHAFVELDESRSGTRWNTIVQVMRLLLMVDGDGINHVLKLGGRGGSDGNGDELTFFCLVGAVVLCCIVLLNLFIAVVGQAYSEAHSQAPQLFLQERAALTVNCMLQPRWQFYKGSFRLLSCCRCCPSYKPKRAAVSCIALALTLIVVWASLVPVEGCPCIIPALSLFVAYQLVGSYLLWPPWSSEEEREVSYLWWCAPTHLMVRSDTKKQEAIPLLHERLDRLERAVEGLTARMTARSPSHAEMSTALIMEPVVSLDERVQASR
eukprot:TRINITY_DN28509_c0_g2_i1.p1 TRINITY_DN28509_c0_g2~~TRINITY_DN28509_c0_g2_i1.p1  ORF type:complete len:892 (+),score=113.82 TRINITY_DN28509_c0_g2_i1:42-2717(+)